MLLSVPLMVGILRSLKQNNLARFVYEESKTEGLDLLIFIIMFHQVPTKIIN